MIVFYIALAGGLGATTRFVVDGYLRTKSSGTFPWATLVINISGSFLLGVLTGLALSLFVQRDLVMIIGTGFLGGYTTFSTASFETVRLIERQQYNAALGYLVGSIGLSLIAAFAGVVLTVLV